jgi:hypothetical protein
MKTIRKLLFSLALICAMPAFGAFLSDPDLNVTGQATQTASGNNIILATAGTGSFDTTGYRSFSIQIIPTGTVSSGVVTFEGSNDNTTFVATPLYDVNSPNTAPVTTISPTTGVNRFMAGAVNYRYIRARISTVIGGGGSLQAITRLSSPVSIAPVTPGNTTSLGGTAIDTNSGNKSAGTQRMVLATDQPNLTTPLNVALAANQSVNNAQVAGTTVDTNSGNKSAGTQRMVLATDQPNLTTPLNTNVAQMGGVATSMNAGAADTGTQRVTIDTDQYFTGAATQTATVNNIIPTSSGASATDVTGFTSGSIQVNSTGTSGAYIFEGSDDNTNFVTIPVFNMTLVTGLPVTAAVTVTATNIIYHFPINFRYIRLRISTIVAGGSIQAFSDFKHAPWTPAVASIASPTTANNLVNNNQVSYGGTAVVTGGVAGTAAVGGNVAHSAAVTANPVGVGGVVTTTLDTTLVNGDVSRAMMTDAGQLIEKQFGSAGNDWSATSGLTPLAVTTSTALKAAGAASIRNYCTAIQLLNTSTTVSTTVTILDGASVIWACNLPAIATTGEVTPVVVVFPTPLRGTAATAMNIQLGTVSASVYYNVQGYQSF